MKIVFIHFLFFFLSRASRPLSPPRSAGSRRIPKRDLCPLDRMRARVAVSRETRALSSLVRDTAAGALERCSPSRVHCFRAFAHRKSLRRVHNTTAASTVCQATRRRNSHRSRARTKRVRKYNNVVVNGNK